MTLWMVGEIRKQAVTAAKESPEINVLCGASISKP